MTNDLRILNYFGENYFDLRIGYACNCRCVHCFVSEQARFVTDLSTDEVKSVIDTLPTTMTIGFTGGEPTFRPDSIDLFKYAKDRGNKVTVQTNGLMLGNPQYADTFSKYVDNVITTMHSHIPEVHNRIEQNYDAFDKAVAGIKNLHERNVNFITQTVITRYNYKNIVNTLDFIQELSPHTRMSLTHPDTQGSANSVEVALRYSEMKDDLQEAFKKYGNMMETYYIPYCYIHPYQNEVLQLDQFFGTVFRPAIIFANEKWKIVNHGELYPDMRSKNKNCQNCVFNQECVGVWSRYTTLYDDSDLAPIYYKETKKSDSQDLRFILDVMQVDRTDAPIYFNDKMNQLKDLQKALDAINKNLRMY